RKSSKQSDTGSYLEGILAITGKGLGYVRVKDQEENVEIDPKFLNTGLHGDTVKVLVHPRREGKQLSGEITEVLSRAKAGFAGTIEEEKGLYFLVPSDTRMYTDILIPKENLGGAKPGQKVFAVIADWKDPQKAPIGNVTEVLGKPGEHNAEMKAIALEKGFRAEFPRAVEKEAEALKKHGITEAEIAKRRDFRGTATFTIDPSDAKDFDDALSFKALPDGTYEIGIHIADVSHYVLPGTALDKEAIKRSTSVYLVDRTIPMLPEALSNDLCSLNPNEDKLTMSAVFIMDKEAEVRSSWFGKTVIHSDKRFTYEEAQEILDKKGGVFYEELATLNTLAKKLTAGRFEAGAISLDQEEVKFVLDESGVPLRVYKKLRQDTNRLIEEFMLLANKKVAEFVATLEKEMVFVYRVHDNPDYDRMRDFTLFLKSLGYNLKMKDNVVEPKALNALVASLEGKPGKDTIQTAIVRSMAKAIYTTKNIGHYGLAFEHYTHFTSPIRRYPDTMVHRLLDKYLGGGTVSEDEWHLYEADCLYASQREKEAADAERASIKYKQVEYMSARVGQVFDGIISGVTEWGIYVEEKETKCEGMVKLRDIGNDFYNFDEKRYRIVGERTQKTFTLGDAVRFKVVAADMARKTIDYIFV
ncbi:MAG: ribonuclease R, partial [bacterium]|nr:ribonuclease R [bacterium]